MYECEKENQKYIDKNKLKSKCCNANIIANSLDEYICDSCLEFCETNSQKEQKQKEDGIPPTSKEVGILPKIIWK